jgi:type II secretory pathway component PulM
MTQRERVMAIAVGALAVLVGGYFVLSAAFSHIEARQDALAAKRNELVQAQNELKMSELKERRIKDLLARSLPAKPDEAAIAYRQWLDTSLRKFNVFPESVINSKAFVESGKEFGKLKFDVNSSARLDDLTDWLHEFNSIDCLHRIKSIRLSAIDNSKLLNVKIEIETISLAKAPNDPLKRYLQPRKIAGKTEAELKARFAADHERLVKSIVNRNLFGPPNSQPTIASIGKQNAIVGKATEVIVKAKDKIEGTNENADEPFLLYRLGENDLPPNSYTFDEVKGILRFTPKKKGEYKATVEVADDGVPRKMASESFTIVVNDAPIVKDAEKKPEPPKPTFDVAKWAFVTAIVEESGSGQVWINERSSGKSQKLKLGDDVKFGSIIGKVSRIDSTGVEVETKDAKFFTKVGQSLGAAASSSAEASAISDGDL